MQDDIIRRPITMNAQPQQEVHQAPGQEQKSAEIQASSQTSEPVIQKTATTEQPEQAAPAIAKSKSNTPVMAITVAIIVCALLSAATIYARLSS